MRSAHNAIKVIAAAGGPAYAIGGVASARDDVSSAVLVGCTVCCDALIARSPLDPVVFSGQYAKNHGMALNIYRLRGAMSWVLTGGVRPGYLGVL